MIRLNNALLSATADTQPPALLPCPPLEGHLYSIRLLLWPLFTKTLDSQIESLKKINGHQTPAGSSGGVGGLLGRMAATGGHQGVKDSTVHAILERYVEWFLTTVEMCSNRRRDLRGGVELRQRQSAEPDQDDPEDEPIFQQSVAPRLLALAASHELTMCTVDLFVQPVEAQRRAGQITGAPEQQDRGAGQAKSFLAGRLRRARPGIDGTRQTGRCTVRHHSTDIFSPVRKLGLTRDRRVQQEIAHYRELARTVQ